MRIPLAFAIVSIAFLLAFGGCLQAGDSGTETGNGGNGEVPQPPAFPDAGQESGVEDGSSALPESLA